MSAVLELIDGEVERIESFSLPRFPFGRLIFKGSAKMSSHAFEVFSLKSDGMVLHLKDGEHSYSMGDIIQGELHLFDVKITLTGRILKAEELFLEVHLLKNIKKLFALETLLLGMRLLKREDIPSEIPLDLCYWLRSDGLVEIFVWEHSDTEISAFQILFLDRVIEWRDGEGISTGKILKREEVEVPLGEKLLVSFETCPLEEDLERGLFILEHLEEGILPEVVLDFMELKVKS